jgi:hypothetical protein
VLIRLNNLLNIDPESRSPGSKTGRYSEVNSWLASPDVKSLSSVVKVMKVPDLQDLSSCG